MTTTTTNAAIRRRRESGSIIVLVLPAGTWRTYDFSWHARKRDDIGDDWLSKPLSRAACRQSMCHRDCSSSLLARLWRPRSGRTSIGRAQAAILARWSIEEGADAA